MSGKRLVNLLATAAALVLLGCATPSAPAGDGWAGAHPLAPPPETPGAGLPIRDEGDFAAGFVQLEF